MAAAKEMNRRRAVKLITATLDRLPSDEDRRAVIIATTSLYPEEDGTVRGETQGGVPAVARRA